MSKDTRLVVIIVALGLAGLLVIMFVFAGLILPAGSGRGGGVPWEKRVARVDIFGEIYSAEGVVEEIRQWGDDNSVRALVLRIESPGGSVAASQEIYEEVKRFRQSGKPVVASMGNLAASGGYYVALGASEIMASPGTLTGSIGVIMTLPNTQELMRKVGLEMQVVKSGSHKDLGSMYRPLSDDERAILQDLLDDAYDQFVDAVSSSRALARDEVLQIADGRVFTGRQAWDLELVDTLGTYQDAVSRAGVLAGLGENPTVVQRRQRRWWLKELLEGMTGVGERALSIASGPRLEYRVAW